MPLINNVNELNQRIGIYTMTPSSGPDPGEDEEELWLECWAKLRSHSNCDSIYSK